MELHIGIGMLGSDDFYHYRILCDAWLAIDYKDERVDRARIYSTNNNVLYVLQSH